eukprot:4839927-Karenia_brevis.AAC.1
MEQFCNSEIHALTMSAVRKRKHWSVGADIASAKRRALQALPDEDKCKFGNAWAQLKTDGPCSTSS